MPALAAAPRAVPLRGTQSHIALQRTSVASASRPARQPRLAAKRRLVVASVQSVPSAVEAVQLEADWAEADREAEKKSAEFDVTASRPKIVCFRVKRILDLTIKEPLGPDGKTPKWPIENYCANPDNFVRSHSAGCATLYEVRTCSFHFVAHPLLCYTQVSMVYPPENVVKSDQYHFEIRLLKLRFFSWFIVPLYRRAATAAPKSYLLRIARFYLMDYRTCRDYSPERLSRRAFVLRFASSRIFGPRMSPPFKPLAPLRHGRRLEMRYLPERGLLARSWDVTLDQDVLPVRPNARPHHPCIPLPAPPAKAANSPRACLFAAAQALLKGIDLSMRMRSVTTVHRRSDEVGEFEDGSGSFRKTLLEARVSLAGRERRKRVLPMPPLHLVAFESCCRDGS